MNRMLRQLISSFAARPARNNATKLEPAELEELVESLPEVARTLRAREANRRDEPRSICTSLKDLCEL